MNPPPNEIVSRKDAKERGLSYYFTGKPCKRGHLAKRHVTCKLCVACKVEWERENLDKLRVQQQRSRSKHRTKRNTYSREWHAKNSEIVKVRVKRHRSKPAVFAALKEYDREYRRQYPWKQALKTQNRRAAKRNATPPWVDKEAISEIYKNRPKGMTVDHIVPLTHELVAGLHVPWNLQYLSPSDNSSKGNRFPCPI